MYFPSVVVYSAGFLSPPKLPLSTRDIQVNKCSHIYFYKGFIAFFDGFFCCRGNFTDYKSGALPVELKRLNNTMMLLW